jgi:NAD(P)-dependent dehydrogenase (short-subunit alcohol dehydrogenase family)
VPLALITGASRGFGRALAAGLAGRGWTLLIDARHRDELAQAAAGIGGGGRVVAEAGDVTDAGHREALRRRIGELGPLQLLVNNASALGPSPLPGLDAHPLEELELIFRTNLVAPLALVQLMLPHMAPDAAVVDVSSDAAVEAYAGWGGYGSSKAALDQVTAVLAVEHPEIRWYAFDPGDMRTAMHQAAYPGEDISDRPLPETVVPALLRLLEQRPASGRYRAADTVGAGLAT